MKFKILMNPIKDTKDPKLILLLKGNLNLAYNKVLRPRMPLNDPEGKILIIDTLVQSRLKSIQNHDIWRNNQREIF